MQHRVLAPNVRVHRVRRTPSSGSGSAPQRSTHIGGGASLITRLVRYRGTDLGGTRTSMVARLNSMQQLGCLLHTLSPRETCWKRVARHGGPSGPVRAGRAFYSATGSPTARVGFFEAGRAPFCLGTSTA